MCSDLRRSRTYQYYLGELVWRSVFVNPLLPEKREFGAYICARNVRVVIVPFGVDMEHLSAVCTGLGCVREDEEGKEVYVKHDDCLGTCKYEI